MALLTASLATDRLVTRRATLAVERRRIESTCAAELARVDQQLAAIDSILSGLRDQAKVIDTLLVGLDNAGLKLQLDDR